jgi:hypothetical protein
MARIRLWFIHNAAFIRIVLNKKVAIRSIPSLLVLL